MPISNTAATNAKPKEQPYTITDGFGLSLYIPTNGSKLWRFRYRFDSKQQMISLGAFPKISIKEAREARDEARKLLAQGINPSTHRKTQKEARKESLDNSFETICREWLEHKKETVELAQYNKAKARLIKDVFPWLGKLPMTKITAPIVLSVLKRIDERGARFTAHRVRSEISQCFRYAIATGRADRDPCPDLIGAIPPARTLIWRQSPM